MVLQDFLAMSVTCFFLIKPKTSASVIVSLRDEILNLQENDFVTGERLQALCDVAFFNREYVESFPSVQLHAKNLIVIDEYISAKTVEIVGRSKTFFIKPDWLNLFVSDFLPHITGEFILLTHMSDLRAGTMDSLLNNSNMRAWYGCNMHPHIKTKSVPLGLENIDMWQRTNVTRILHARTNRKTETLYVYFNLNSNLPKRTEARTHLIQN